MNAKYTTTITNDEAAIYVLRFCEKHPGWKRICDIENNKNLYKTWEELLEKDKKTLD